MNYKKISILLQILFLILFSVQFLYAVTQENNKLTSQSLVINYIVSDNQLFPLEFEVGTQKTLNDNFLIYLVGDIPKGVNFNKLTGHFMWNPGCSQNGIYVIELNAVDDGNKISYKIIITVIDDC